MTEATDSTEDKSKGTYHRWVWTESVELEEWFRERGIDPQRASAILDAFRYPDLCRTVFEMPNDEAEQVPMAILDLIDELRSTRKPSSLSET